MEKRPVIYHDMKKAPRTGDWRYMCPEVDKDKCIGCEICVPFCPEAAIEMVPYEKASEKNKSKEIASVDYDFCKGCGVCAAVCPSKAIRMTRKVVGAE